MDIVGVDARCAAIDVGRLDGRAVSHAKDGQLSPVHVEARRAAMDVGKLDAPALSHAEDGCLSSDITVENRDRGLTHNVSVLLVLCTPPRMLLKVTWKIAKLSLSPSFS